MDPDPIMLLNGTDLPADAPNVDDDGYMEIPLDPEPDSESQYIFCPHLFP